MEKIGIGSDHAGYDLKELLKEILKEKGYEITDYGPDSDASTDYPEYAHLLANGLNTGSVQRGILICGSGNGIGMTANKHNGIRAALCWTEEIAELARLHNDANVLSLPARFIDTDLAKDIMNTFLNTDFEGGRHQRRVDKINK